MFSPDLLDWVDLVGWEWVNFGGEWVVGGGGRGWLHRRKNSPDFRSPEVLCYPGVTY